jgi:hypothetical protein
VRGAYKRKYQPERINPSRRNLEEPALANSHLAMIMEGPGDPVFWGGNYLFRVEIGRGTRGGIAKLSPRKARRLACALLFEAEKGETMECSHRMKRLANTLDRAVPAVSRFHSKDETLQSRKRHRDFSKELRKKEERNCRRPSITPAIDG